MNDKLSCKGCKYLKTKELFNPLNLCNMCEENNCYSPIESKENQVPKVFINHGIFTWNSMDGSSIKVRNTNKYFPLPLKFRKTLNSYYLRWFHVQKTIKYHNRKIRINVMLDGKIEFTIAHCPDSLDDIKVITICYPFEDQFERKEGVKWVRKRMKEALLHPHVKVWWKHTSRR